MFPIKLIGGAFAGMALFAGLSVWLLVGGCHAAWTDASRPVTRVMSPKPFSESLPLVGTMAAICAGLHVGTWFARRVVLRRDAVLEMSPQFWNVLSVTAYVVGFLAGAGIYFSSPM